MVGYCRGSSKYSKPRKKPAARPPVFFRPRKGNLDEKYRPGTHPLLSTLALAAQGLLLRLSSLHRCGQLLKPGLSRHTPLRAVARLANPARAPATLRRGLPTLSRSATPQTGASRILRCRVRSAMRWQRHRCLRMRLRCSGRVR